MTAVVFETPGLIDVRAFTIMGAHAKPNSANPIGYFGTGAKYAIAVLVRLGAEPIVWIGKDRLAFSKREALFRGTPLETIVMKVLKAGNKRATSYEMPYTTSYGKNWEPWQAFRELESNTRDEGGRTYLVDTATYGDNRLERERYALDEVVTGADGMTRIVVDLPAFAEAAALIDTIFLPRGSRGAKDVVLEATDGPSEHLYYRTMRAADIKKPALFTYNFLEHLDLTEDRTIKYEFYAKAAVARWVLSAATEEQVAAILSAPEEAWEYGLEFPGYVAPSPAFEAVMRARRVKISKMAWSYYGAYAPRRREPKPEVSWTLFNAHPRPWKVEGLEIRDAVGNAVMAAPEGYYDDWETTAQAVCERIKVLST